MLPEEHGTAVVSLLVSPQFGVLPDAQLYVACVFYEDRRGGSLSEAQDLVRALDWLMKRRVPVINMSLSGPPNEVLRVAIKRAVEAGHLIVAAVGNAGPASPPLYPAAYEGVSRLPPWMADSTCTAAPPEVRTLNLPRWVWMSSPPRPPALPAYSGTSFASPYVAALAAMEYRSLDPQESARGQRDPARQRPGPGQTRSRRSLWLWSGASARDRDRRPLMRALVACVLARAERGRPRNGITAI